MANSTISYATKKLQYIKTANIKNLKVFNSNFIIKVPEIFIFEFVYFSNDNRIIERQLVV